MQHRGKLLWRPSLIYTQMGAAGRVPFANLAPDDSAEQTLKLQTVPAQLSTRTQ